MKSVLFFVHKHDTLCLHNLHTVSIKHQNRNAFVESVLNQKSVGSGMAPKDSATAAVQVFQAPFVMKVRVSTYPIVRGSRVGHQRSNLIPSDDGILCLESVSLSLRCHDLFVYLLRALGVHVRLKMTFIDYHLLVRGYGSDNETMSQRCVWS